MREGAKKTKAIAGNFLTTLIDPGEEPKVAACAVGAVEHEFSGARHFNGWLSQEVEEALSTEIPFTHWPEKVNKINAAEAPLKRVVMCANDKTDMSREAIAEWVGWLIDDKGYDLYVEQEVKQSCDKTKENDGLAEPVEA